MSIYAWHFTDGNKLRDGTPLPAVGEWLEYEGEIHICRSGYHYSLLPSDALLYAPGDRIHLVECDDIVKTHDNKGVCRRRRIIASMDAEEMLRYYARMQALSVVMNAPEMSDVVYDWIFTGDESLRPAADSAARYAAHYAADSAARSAAYSAAYSAVRSAVDSAAYSAVDSAADSAARSAVDSAFNELVYECFEGPMKELNWKGN